MIHFRSVSHSMKNGVKAGVSAECGAAIITGSEDSSTD